MRFGYWAVQTFVRVVLTVVWGLKISGKRNLPPVGPVIVASNHIAFIDPPVIGASVWRESHFAAKKELFNNFLLKPVISYLNTFPVKRTGFDNAALKICVNALKSGGVLVFFPEGTRSRTGVMLPFKRGIGYLVAKTGAAVLPTYISGTNELRKRLFKPGGITIRFGEPIHNLLNAHKGEGQYEKIAAEVQKAVMNLKAEAD